jgi:oligopeptide/dipeptide ABC transporter ATP-binding protein
VLHAGVQVEQGPARCVLDRPRHPYTAALCRARPRPGHGLPEPLPGLPPAENPGGCSFRLRCPRADAACLQAPPLRALPEGPEVRCACHHPEDR